MIKPQKIEGGVKLLRLVTFGVDVSENQDDGVWSIATQNGLENLFGKRIYNLSYRDVDEHPTTPIQDISQCPNCLCMTKTVKGKCGKCKEIKSTPIQDKKEKCPNCKKGIVSWVDFSNVFSCSHCFYTRTKPQKIEGGTTTPIQETWQEEFCDSFIMKANAKNEDWRLTYEQSIKILSFIESLLQRKERETIKRVMEVIPEKFNAKPNEAYFIGWDACIDQWTDNITKLTTKEEI